jgi:hypothetical protein
MLTRTKTGKVKKYNEQECWEVYMGMGAAASQKKLINWLWEERRIKASNMGPVWAMWRWALKNPEQCYEQYKKWWFESASQEGVDSNVSFRDFLEDVKHHCRHRSMGSRKEYEDFCAKYGL